MQKEQGFEDQKGRVVERTRRISVMELWARHAMARINHQQDPVVCSEIYR